LAADRRRILGVLGLQLSRRVLPMRWLEPGGDRVSFNNHFANPAFEVPGLQVASLLHGRELELSKENEQGQGHPGSEDIIIECVICVSVL
jgi:hypothetical protein